jgi:hypothetical protein
MLALNLLPRDVQLLRRGHRRTSFLGVILLMLITVLCATGVGMSVWMLLGDATTERFRSVEAEVMALRRHYEAQKRTAVREREAYERDITFDSRRKRGLLAFRLAQCAVPDNATLSAMHLKRGELVWLGAAQDSRGVAEMLSRITRCCAALKPLMTRMKREDVHGVLREDFEVRIPFPDQDRDLLLCHEGAQHG